MSVTDDLEGIEHVSNLAWWGYQAIKAIGGLLLFLFAWLQIKDVPLGTLVQNTTPQRIIKVSLILYYTCWIGGATFDTKVQQKVYVSDPKRGQITLELLTVIAGFCAVALALVWASSHQEFFGALLLIFVAVNICAWMLIVARVKPVIASSREISLKSAENLFRLEQLQIVEKYMTGSWQIHRFGVMIAMIAFAIAISYLDGIRLLLALPIASVIKSVTPGTIAESLPLSISILLFVVVAEAWIWIRREHVRFTLAAMDDLRQRYILTPVSK